MAFEDFWWSSGGGPTPPIPGTTSSVRFFNNQFLFNNTVGIPNNNFTLSMWVKYAISNSPTGLIGSNTGVNDGYSIQGDTNTLRSRTAAGWGTSLSTGVLRDPAAWYHFVFQNDSGTTQAFINGVQQADTSATFAATNSTIIGAANNNVPDEVFDGYITEIHMLDGQLLAPTSFGTTNAEDVWVPIETSFTSAQYGPKGYHLTLQDVNNLGADTAPIGAGHTTANNFVPNNINVTPGAGTDFDAMTDGPSQNFSTWSSIIPASAGGDCDPSDGNLTLRGASAATIGRKLPGETIYFELETGFVNNGRAWANWWNVIQILNGRTDTIDGGQNGAPPQSMLNNGGFAFDISANVFANNVSEQVEISSVNLAADDTIGVQIDDNNITVFINGVASSGINNLAFANNFPDGMYIYARNASNAGATSEFMHINFGQQPYSGRPAGITDDVNLQTQNLPDPAITNGRDSFQAIEGAGATILNTATTTFPSGLYWIKDMDNTSNNLLVNSIEGAPETRLVNDGTTGAYPTPAGESIAWSWNWNQAQPQQNGFNILDFNATGATVTVDTGLTLPEFCLFYSPASSNTFMGLRALGDGNMAINSDGIFSSGNTIVWQTGANANEMQFDSSVMSGDCKLFVWQSVPGYSAFGTYTGNGSSDGPFVYTGFRPAFVMIKSSTQGFDWYIWDTTRNPTNPCQLVLKPSKQTSEDDSSGNPQIIDILSNGFKIRNDNQVNQPNAGECWVAFAENPFGGGNVAPANAR